MSLKLLMSWRRQRRTKAVSTPHMDLSTRLRNLHKRQFRRYENANESLPAASSKYGDRNEAGSRLSINHLHILHLNEVERLGRRAMPEILSVCTESALATECQATTAGSKNLKAL